jgi:hypothetical protein
LKADSYQRLKTHTFGELDRLNLQILRHCFLEESPLWDEFFERFDLVLLRGRIGSKEKTAWFDLFSKIDFSRWEISNHWIK